MPTHIPNVNKLQSYRLIISSVCIDDYNNPVFN